MEAFDPELHQCVVDGTLGGGGHSRALLERGIKRVIGLDRDRDALEAAAERLHGFSERITLIHSPFSDIAEQLQQHGVSQVDGILVDLGVSSYQLDTASRGFGFRSTGPLDMRMNQAAGETAADLLDQWGPQELADVLRTYGEVPGAWKLAHRILDARTAGELETTADLATLVENWAPPALRKRKVHPATLVFQALRLAVNRELEELETLLECAPGLLRPGGRLAVISFHSLEDRRVKWAFRKFAGRLPQEGPERWRIETKRVEFREVTRKPIVGTEQEIRENPRARSAKLRILEKLSEDET